MFPSSMSIPLLLLVYRLESQPFINCDGEADDCDCFLMVLYTLSLFSSAFRSNTIFLIQQYHMNVSFVLKNIKIGMFA